MRGVACPVGRSAPHSINDNDRRKQYWLQCWSILLWIITLNHNHTLWRRRTCSCSLASSANFLPQFLTEQTNFSSGMLLSSMLMRERDSATSATSPPARDRTLSQCPPSPIRQASTSAISFGSNFSLRLSTMTARVLRATVTTSKSSLSQSLRMAMTPAMMVSLYVCLYLRGSYLKELSAMRLESTPKQQQTISLEVDYRRMRRASCILASITTAQNSLMRVRLATTRRLSQQISSLSICTTKSTKVCTSCTFTILCSELVSSSYLSQKRTLVIQLRMVAISSPHRSMLVLRYRIAFSFFTSSLQVLGWLRQMSWPMGGSVKRLAMSLTILIAQSMSDSFFMCWQSHAAMLNPIFSTQFFPESSLVAQKSKHSQTSCQACRSKQSWLRMSARQLVRFAKTIATRTTMCTLLLQNLKKLLSVFTQARFSLSLTHTDSQLETLERVRSTLNISYWLVGNCSTSRAQAYRQLLSRKARQDFSSTARCLKQAVSCISTAFPELLRFLSVQMHRQRFSNRKYSSCINSRLNLALAERFFTIEHAEITTSSKQPLYGPTARLFGSALGFSPSSSVLVSARGSFLDSEESLPRDEGRTAGSSSTFLSEFLRMRVGLRSTRVDSASRCPTKAQRVEKIGLMMAASSTNVSFFSS